jgi:hypothetical protein
LSVRPQEGADNLALNTKRQVVGIDFSGNHAMWSPGCRRTNVWVAMGALKGDDVVLGSLVPVQDLSSSLHPFSALADFVNGLEEGYVGIDAPFSLPAEFISEGGVLAWQEVARLTPVDRPFPRGGQLVGAFAPNLPSRGAKVFRETEKYWISKGVNVRSTTWAGPRGGAPFAVACMTLLAGLRGSVWSLTDGQGAVIVEAFPAAQLRHWGLPFTQYSGREHPALMNRRSILVGMEERGLLIDPRDRLKCEASPDALDAVVCMFAGIAVAIRQVAVAPGKEAKKEGHIVVRA